MEIDRPLVPVTSEQSIAVKLVVSETAKSQTRRSPSPFLDQTWRL